jgi:molybdenum cofactor cytidylyltransferase
MNQPRLSVLIPAAGASKRLGQPKQLVRMEGIPLLQRAIDSARTPLLRWIHNPDWPDGLGGSIAAGAAAISPESTGLMIILSDQWRIEARDLQTLWQTWKSDPRRIAVAEAQGQHMPPVIFPSACFEQLQNLQGQQGARNLFKSYADLLTPVTMQHAAIDLDTPNNLKELTNPP